MSLKPELEGYRGNIPKLYAVNFLTSFMLFVPVIVLFFQENGLNLTEVMVLQSAFSIAQIVLEVPSGYFADRYGRRRSMIYGSGFLFAGISFYSLGGGFTDFLLAEMIFAVGGALRSGSKSALAYDSLLEIGEEDRFKHVKGRLRSIMLISGAAASIFGGLVADYSLRATIAGSAVPLLLMVPLTFWLKETTVHQKEATPKYSKDLGRILRETLIEKIKIRYIILFAAVVGASTHVGFFLYQPYLKEVNVPIVYFGVIFASYNILSALISEKASLIEQKIGMDWSLTLTLVSAILGFALLSGFPFFYAFLFIALHQLVRGLMDPLVSDYINKITSSQDRSTVLSVKGLLDKVVYSAWIPLIGVVSDTFGIVQAMSLVGVMLGALAIPLLWMLSLHDVI